DKEAARSLLRGKAGRRPLKKKPKGVPVWLKASGIILALLMLGGVVYFATRPPSPASLARKAERLWAKGTEDAQAEARDGPIKEYLARYGSRDDVMTAKVRAMAEEYDERERETMLGRYLRWYQNRRGIEIKPQTDADALAFKAGVAEDEGDRDE